MQERDFQTKFTRWLNYRFEGNGAFELKICHEKSLPFDAVQDHQLDALRAAKHTGIVHKIADDSRGAKPFDCFKLKGEAYVVIMFYTRGCNHFYLFDIDLWEKEIIDASQREKLRKSITEERALEIGIRKEFN